MDWNQEIKYMEGWHFGGKGSGLEDSLLKLVLKGFKTATCSWYESYAITREKIPKIGDRSFIMNSNDEPVCVIEVIEVQIKPFLEVDEEFAYFEGEGDRSYIHWKSTHEEFFRKYGNIINLKWNSETQSVVCEKFKVIHIFNCQSPSFTG